jgi:endogenous inhibitor of DNA gyrase (YacG/DUF329 family)
MSRGPRHDCPICGREAAPPQASGAALPDAPDAPGPRPGNASFPFCSPRCKLVDLGRWLDGGYRIPGPIVHEGGPPEDDE